MSVILLILKIIGIILLALLGLVLLLFVLILFWPIQYVASGMAEGQLDAKIRMSWLFRIISYRVEISGKEMIQMIKIFGIPLKEKNRCSKKRKKAKKKKVSFQNSNEQYENINTTKKESSTLEAATENATVSPPKKMKKNGKIRTFFQKIKKSIQKIKTKFSDLKNLISRIWEEVRKDTNKAAVKTLFQEIKYLLRHISPRKVKANIHFGMGEPAKTGQTLGFIATLPFVYRYQLQIYPDFQAESFFMKGTFRLKGHVRIIHVLIAGIRLIRDKNIRDLLQILGK